MKQHRKNILFLLHLPPPVHGSTIVGKQIKDSKIINYEFKGRYVNLILSKKVNESGKVNLIKALRFLRIWFKLFGLLLFRRPDLCYFALTTTGAGFKKDVLLIALLRIFNVKILYHLHNKGISQLNKKDVDDFLYRFVFAHSFVILLSENLYYDIERYVPMDMIHICSNGIKDYQPVAALSLTPEIRPFNILFLSNLLVDKGVYDLIDACSILNKKGLYFNCDFVGGEGNISVEEFNKYVNQKGLSNKVKYLGKRYGKLKEMTYEQADIFVFPTRNECFGLVLLEAMQHRLPVIATYEGGIPDIVEDGKNGYLIEKGDVNALAAKIEILLRYPEIRVKMGNNGRATYENKFTDEIFEQKMLRILKNVIKN